MISRSLFRIYLNALVLVVAGVPSIGLAASSPAITNLSPVTAKVSAPVRLAADQFMNFYLTDPRAGGINKYDRTGKWIATIPVTSPQGIVVTAGQDLIVSQRDKVTVFSNAGVARFTLKDSQGATFAFKYANGVVVDPATGYIYVADSLDDCILVFSSQGNPVVTGKAAAGKPANSFGSTGSSFGQFSLPTGLTFEKNSSQLTVADTFNGRVQFFDVKTPTPTFAFQKSIGSLGSGPLAFTFPESVAFEYTPGSSQTLSRMYVLDSYQSRVQVIDPAGSGAYLREIGGYGRGIGKLRNPSDMVFDSLNSRLVVANGLGSLTTYGIDSGTTPGPVDTSPPPLLVNPATDFATNQSSVTFTGTVEKGAVVAVTANTPVTVGQVAYLPSSSANTNAWSVTVSNLGAGANILTFTAYDNSINPSTVSRIVTFSAVNAVAFTLNPVTTPTSSASQVLSGTMDSGATVAATSTTATIGVATYPTATSWSLPITGMAAGPNTFTIVATLAGKTPSTTAAMINYLSAPPSLQISALSSGSTTATQLLTIRGSVAVDENFDKVTVVVDTVNGGAPVIFTSDKILNGTFAVPVLLAVGENIITVTASDKALPTSNSATDTRTIKYDPTLGLTTISSPVATDGIVTAAVALDLTGTAPAGATSVRITYLLSGTPTTATVTTANGTWTATAINLDPGMNTIQATAFIATSQLTSSSLTVTRVSTDQPTLSVTAPAGDLTTGTTSVTVSGSAGAATVTAMLDRAAVPVTFTPGTPGNFNLSLSTLAEGAHLLAVTATDAFGNSVTSYRSIRIKISPPANFSLTPFTGQTTTLSGTLEPGSTIFVKDTSGNNLVPPQTVGADGTWSVTLPSPYDPATMNLFALDQAGNSTRNGRLANDNRPPDITDAVSAMQIARGHSIATIGQLLHGDVAPLVNGKPAPDGIIDSGDVLVILRKLLGFINY